MVHSRSAGSASADAVVTGTENRSAGRLIVTALAPADFRTTLGFMQKEYPAAGLTLAGGEVEEGDAESDFTGPEVEEFNAELAAAYQDFGT